MTVVWIFIWINLAYAHVSSDSLAKTCIVFDFRIKRGCLTVPSSCILGPITWFHSSQKIAPIHSEAAGDGAAGTVGGGSGRTGEKGPNTQSCLFNCRWQGWWQHDHCVIMITPQRHLPPSSRLHSGSRYNLIHCAVGGADTIMQGISTGVITVVCERRMKKARQKKRSEKRWSDDDGEAKTYN